MSANIGMKRYSYSMSTFEHDDPFADFTDVSAAPQPSMQAQAVAPTGMQAGDQGVEWAAEPTSPTAENSLMQAPQLSHEAALASQETPQASGTFELSELSEASADEPLAMGRKQARQAQQHHSMASQWSALPNLITLGRIVLMVVFLACYILAGPWGYNSLALRWVAVAVFAVAAFTDKLDGWLARRNDTVTDFGKLLDPIADKLLILPAMIVASVYGELLWWITALFVVREVGITLLRLFVVERRGIVISASSVGKYKTLMECLGLGLLLLPVWSFTNVSQPPQWLPIYFTAVYTAIYIALILCIYSGVMYVFDVFQSDHADAGRHGKSAA